MLKCQIIPEDIIPCLNMFLSASKDACMLKSQIIPEKTLFLA
jgi:hypothetical protein